MKKRVRTDIRQGRAGQNRLHGASVDFTATAEELTLRPDVQKEIQQLVELLKQHNLTELEVERQGLRLRLRRETAPGVPAAVVLESATGGQRAAIQSPATPPKAETPGLMTIRSPIVGTFYRAPSADADPYVEEGDLVKKGQVLCIVEAMKLMNEIESEVDGRIVSILAESTKPVEYGQPLFLIDPTPAS